MGHRDRLRRGAARRLGDAGDEEIRRRVPGRGGGAATSSNMRSPELSTHDNQRVTKALNDGLQAALTGTKTPQQAMADAQAEADRILKPYR